MQEDGFIRMNNICYGSIGACPVPQEETEDTFPVQAGANVLAMTALNLFLIYHATKKVIQLPDSSTNKSNTSATRSCRNWRQFLFLPDLEL